MTTNILKKDQYGNAIVTDIDGLWDISLTQGWHVLGSSDTNGIDTYDLDYELGIEEWGEGLDFLDWLVENHPTVHQISYEEIHGGCCNAIDFYVSQEPLSSEWYKKMYQEFLKS